jgi:hypothetical protein
LMMEAHQRWCRQCQVHAHHRYLCCCNHLD